MTSLLRFACRASAGVEARPAEVLGLLGRSDPADAAQLVRVKIKDDL